MSINGVKFQLGPINLVVDDKRTVIEKDEFGLIDIEVYGSEDDWDLLWKQEDFIFEGMIYAPQFYLRGIPYREEKTSLDMDEDDPMGMKESGIYLMEHCPLDGVYYFKDGRFLAFGNVHVFSKIYPFKVEMELPSNLENLSN